MSFETSFVLLLELIDNFYQYEFANKDDLTKILKKIVWENTSLLSIRGLMMGPTFVMQHWELMAAMLKHSKGKSSFALGEKPVIPHLLLLAFWSAFWSFFCSPAFASRSAVKGWNGKRQSHHKLKTVHFTVGYFCPFLAQVKYIMLNPV